LFCHFFPSCYVIKLIFFMSLAVACICSV